MPLTPPERWSTGNPLRRIRLSEAFITQTYGGAAGDVVTAMEFPTPSNTKTGTVSGSMTLNGTTVGTHGGTGAVAGSVALAGTVVGKHATSGTVAGSLTLTGTAVGTKAETNPDKTGTVAGALPTISGTVAGKHGGAGATAGTLTLSGTTAGTKGATGAAAGTVTLDGTATGTEGRTAAVAGTIALSAVVTGTKYDPDAPVVPDEPPAGGGRNYYRLQSWDAPAPPEAKAGRARGVVLARATVRGERSSTGTASGRCAITATTRGTKATRGRFFADIEARAHVTASPTEPRDAEYLALYAEVRRLRSENELLLTL